MIADESCDVVGHRNRRMGVEELEHGWRVELVGGAGELVCRDPPHDGGAGAVHLGDADQHLEDVDGDGGRGDIGGGGGGGGAGPPIHT